MGVRQEKALKNEWEKQVIRVLKKYPERLTRAEISEKTGLTRKQIYMGLVTSYAPIAENDRYSEKLYWVGR